MERCNDKELISILMPTYNVEQFVEEAVKSILSQTYDKFELIIVDDCSTDTTFDILRSLEAQDKRIKLYRNETNCKICKTLNRALRYAKGSYIARMDGDDVSVPERLEMLKKFLDEHLDVSLVGSNMITIDEMGRELSRKRYIRTDSYIQKGNSYQPCVAHIWLARREVYDDLNGYREVPYVEDWDFLLRGQNRGFHYANVDAFIYKCRIRNGNTGTTNGLRQRKAGKYILRLYRKEKKSQRNEFEENDYCTAMNCFEKEESNYRKAAQHLDIAVHSRDNKYKLVVNTLKAMLESKYMASYVYEAAMLRLVLEEERMHEKKGVKS